MVILRSRLSQMLAIITLAIIAIIPLQTSVLAAVTLTARADASTCYRDRNIVVNVLQNDYYNGDGGLSSVAVAVSTLPSHGVARILSDKTIQYTPAAGYTGNDTLFYKLSVLVDGKRLQSIASVSFNVRGIIQLQWDPPNAHDAAIIQGYRMYTGPNCSSLTLRTDLSIAKGQVTMTDPRANYNPLQDLGLTIGNVVYFAVRAYAATPTAIESGFSNCVSATINRI